ncbi:MAG: UDP-N-acetylglucosamine 2-epimerase (non-hydrolyzing), partial [Deltaproteobacteria bacterium]|nr:UDP-N-acetylglucosamine 2-epimerase (non-hydrolyzing) [Deltaproteobacteria bacterium]
MANPVVLLVAGARPNFMKLAALRTALLDHGGLEVRMLLTGQHRGEEMCDRILADLELPAPDRVLDAGASPPAFLPARLFEALRTEFERRTPALVVVVGDVTSTAAAALAARVCGIPLAHVEAGLRAFDRTMPEEVNRILADHASDLLFTTEEAAGRNLEHEGIDQRRIFFTGNVMVDTLQRFLPKTDRATPRRHALRPGAYALLTAHRAGNVDRGPALNEILKAAAMIARRMPVLFPVHPRTRARLGSRQLALPAGVRISPPLGYLDFVDLLKNAALVMTDSGGVQQESAVLGIPCVTLRDRTEVP